MPTIVDAHPTSALGQRTLDDLENGLRGTSTAGLADIVRLVQMLSSDSADISVHELADIIEKDAVVSTKSISAANKLGFNTHGVEIATIPQAIQVVGFNKIRSLAVSLLLLENANQLHHLEQRHNTKISLCVGLLSRQWARLHERTDPDRYFLCGSLRNFGRLLLSSHLIDEYREALRDARATGDTDRVFSERFGLNPAELTYRLLERVFLPAPILNTLSPLPLDSAARTPQSELEEIGAVSEFFLKYCEFALDPSVEPQPYVETLQRLLKATPAAQLKHEGLDQLLEQTEKVLKIYGEGSPLGMVSLPLAHQLALRRVRPAAPPPAPRETAESNSVLAPSTVPAGPASLEERIHRLSDELQLPLLKWDRLLPPTLAFLAHHWEASHVALFLANGGSYRFVGSSDAALALRLRTAAFRPTDPHLLSLSLIRGEPVALHDLTATKIQHALPAWLQGPDLKSGLLLPNGAKEQASALLFVGWKEPRKVAVPSETARLHRTLLNLLSTAQRLIHMQ